MRNFNPVLLLLLSIAACSTVIPKQPLIEEDVFIVSLKKNFNEKGKLILKDRSQAIHFSKDFWNYFIRTHPKSSGIIFGSPLYDERADYLNLGDTSLAFYNGDVMSTYFFKKLLTDDADNKEGEDFGPAFFVVPNDTTGQAEKEKRIEKRLKDYKLTDDVRQEYKQFSEILKGTNSSNHYIIIFKKDFINRLYEIYE